jgi:hypothetical protein
MAVERDAVDEMITERTARNPDFPRLMQEAMARRERGYQSPPSDSDQQTALDVPLTARTKAGTARLAARVREPADRHKHKTPA